MAFIHNNCPNCGGAMKLQHNQFVCPFCGTSVLHIADAKIDGDVTVMSAAEFAAKIEATKKQFVINIKNDLKVFDIDTMVINKKIKDATAALAKEEFSSVERILEGVPDTILSAERLRYLAMFEVKNEQELSIHHGYVENDRYYRILSLADEQTRATYEKIASFCREQYAVREAMEQEIREGDKLLSVQLYYEAEVYAKQMCRKYPQLMASWLFLYKVRRRRYKTHVGQREYEMMRHCYDFMERRVPYEIEQEIKELQKEKERLEMQEKAKKYGAFREQYLAEQKYYKGTNLFLKFIVSLAFVLGEIAVALLCTCTPLTEKGLFFTIFGIVCGVVAGWSGVFMIVFLVKWRRVGKTIPDKEYEFFKKYARKKRNAWIFLSLMIVFFAVVAVSLIIYHDILKLVLLAVGAVLLGGAMWAVIIWLIVKYIKSQRW